MALVVGLLSMARTLCSGGCTASTDASTSAVCFGVVEEKEKIESLTRWETRLGGGPVTGHRAQGRELTRDDGSVDGGGGLSRPAQGNATYVVGSPSGR